MSDLPRLGAAFWQSAPCWHVPSFLSTSRHVTQGILEVREESWNDSTQTLGGRSAVVGGDHEMRIVAQTPKQNWSVAGVEVSPEDRAVGVTITCRTADGLVKAVVTSPVNRRFIGLCGSPSKRKARGR